MGEQIYLPVRFSFALYALSVVAVAVAIQSTPATLLTLALGAMLYGWMTWRYRTLPPLYLLFGCVARVVRIRDRRLSAAGMAWFGQLAGFGGAAWRGALGGFALARHRIAMPDRVWDRAGRRDGLEPILVTTG